MKKKILIIEDDPAILDSMILLVESEGYDVETMTDTTKLETIKDICPDVILLDIWMSGQDGRTIAKQLKSHEETKSIPIIMVSASKDIEKSAKDAGVEDYLAKPFEMDELLSKINNCLN